MGGAVVIRKVLLLVYWVALSLGLHRSTGLAAFLSNEYRTVSASLGGQEIHGMFLSQ